MANKLLSLVAGLTALVMTGCNNNPKQDLSNPPITPIKTEIKKEIIIPKDSIAKYDPIFKERVPEMKLDKKENRLAVVFNNDGSVNSLPAYESLYKQGIFPTIANSYSKRGDYLSMYGGVIWLAGNNISPNLEKQYSSRFSFNDIKYLIEENISSEKAEQYDESFSSSEIVSLFKDAISSKQANSLKDFDTRKIVFFNNELKKLNLPLKIITNYTSVNQEFHRAFFSDEIIGFVKNKISPETINKYIKLGDKYGHHLSGEEIIDFEKKGIPFEKIKEKCLERYINSKLE